MHSLATYPLPVLYHELVSSSIDAAGIEIPHGMLIDASGGLTVAALAVPAADAYRVMLALITEKKAAEAIFALDRFAKPGQGTTLGDLMAGHHFANGRWRPFIIEYRHEPRVVQPIDWCNEFWNAALTSELAGSMRDLVGAGGERV